MSTSKEQIDILFAQEKFDYCSQIVPHIRSGQGRNGSGNARFFGELQES